jgi:hypothetical protein
VATSQKREACLEAGVAALIAALEFSLIAHAGDTLLSPDDLLAVQTTSQVSPSEFASLFGDATTFEHEVLSRVLNSAGAPEGLDQAAESFGQGFRLLPSEAMELSPRASFRTARDDGGFRVLLQLAVAGLVRVDVLERCRDYLAILDNTWTSAPLLDSLGMLGLELRPPFSDADVTELFQMLLMGALLRELILPKPGREDLLSQAVQALFLGFTRDIGEPETLRDRLDKLDDRWPTFELDD